MYRIGVDVGGTNTDAAILDAQLNVVYAVKVPTTADVESGIYEAVRQVLEGSGVKRPEVRFAMLGTTHCTNALLERKRLNKVAAIRLGRPATTALPPFTDWPEDLRGAVEGASLVAGGGYEFDGRLIAPLDEAEIRDFCAQLGSEVKAVAISGVFAPINKEQEQQAAAWVRDVRPDLQLSLSHEIGSIGLLERENATILNAALFEVGRLIVDGFQKSLSALGLSCEVYFSQNDGTLMNADYALRYPILTIGCGPTNSIRGAAHLSGLQNAIVVDVGGTTSDFGVLAGGFPRQSAQSVTIGGVRTHFPMPDVHSIALGGGTIISEIEDGQLQVGPQSVGYRIHTEAILFGGGTFTVSDAAARMGLAFTERRAKVAELSEVKSAQVLSQIKTMLEDAVDQMKSSSADEPLIVVGGGSVVVPSGLAGVSEQIRPQHHDSANAVGAALGQISGTVERIYSLSSVSREEALEAAKRQAIQEAVSAGADAETVQITQMEDIPLSYLPGQALLVRAKAVGNIRTVG